MQQQFRAIVIVFDGCEKGTGLDEGDLAVASRVAIIGTSAGRARVASVRGCAADRCVYMRGQAACGRFPHVRATSVIRRARGPKEQPIVLRGDVIERRRAWCPSLPRTDRERTIGEDGLRGEHHRREGSR